MKQFLFLAMVVFSLSVLASPIRLDKDTCVVLPPGSTPTALFAGKELSGLLGKVLNCKISIVSEVRANACSIIVGDNPYSRELGIKVAELERDAFRIRSRGSRIAIVGRDDRAGNPALLATHYFEHATLFGVYEFLERYAGVRFYFPGEFGTITPRRDKIELQEIDFYGKPDHTQRRIADGGIYFDEKVPMRSGRMLQQYRLRMQTYYVPNCHSLERSGYFERFAKSRPEFFAMDESQRRYTDRSHPSYGSLCLMNRGFREELYRDAASFLKGEPASVRGVMSKGRIQWDASVFLKGFFNIMPGDWHRPCQCPECSAYRRAHGRGSTVWDIVASTAERLKADNIPGQVTAMSYAYYGAVPERDIPDNVEVMVSVPGPWSERDRKLSAEGDKLIDDWNKKLGRKVWLWTYPNKYGANALPGIPNMAPRAVAAWYGRVAPKVFGTFMEAETDRWIFGYLNNYLYAKIAWDNKFDSAAALEEHDRLMFGLGAPEMKKFYESLENVWMKRLLGKITITDQGPINVPPSDAEIWDKIFTPQQLADYEALFAAAAAKCSTDPDAKKRILFIREQFLHPIIERAERYRHERDAIADRNFPVMILKPEQRISIDGDDSEQAWQNVKKSYLVPFTDTPIEAKTMVRGLCDDKNLYFFFECMEPRVDEIVTRQTKRDHKDVWRDSGIEIFLNPSGNQYFHWMINANGTIADSACIREGASSRVDAAWDSKCTVATRRGKDRWTLEIAIPKSELPSIPSEGFQANFARHRVLSGNAVKTKLYTWTPFLRGFHEVENFGRIVFDLGPEQSLIRNGDFSKPFKGTWHAPAGASLDENFFISGGQSAKLSGEGTIALHQSLKLKPNTRYAVSFLVKLDNVKPLKRGGGACILLGDNHNNFFPANAMTGTSSWTRMGFFWTTRDEKKLNGCIRLYLLNASGTVWFDNIRLVELPSQPLKKD